MFLYLFTAHTYPPRTVRVCSRVNQARCQHGNCVVDQHGAQVCRCYGGHTGRRCDAQDCGIPIHICVCVRVLCLGVRVCVCIYIYIYIYIYIE